MKACRNKAERHAYLLSLLGVRQIVVVVNKMDLADYSEKRFREIEDGISRNSLQTLNLEPRVFIPASAEARRKHRAKEQQKNEVAQRADAVRRA